MSTIRLEITTAERQVFADDVNAVVAPGIEGELGILPQHAPLMTMLAPGEMMVKKANEEIFLAVTGGFMEVRPDKIIILADACERCEEIDLDRAEDARRRAQERLKSLTPGIDHTRVEASLRRSLARIKVAQRMTKRRNFPPQ
ncbi:MAG: ATP synthase F1 subunit epsilon [Chloroflexi bacterium RBG_16_48_7]|nr:MAG: ATP synthase F1 subunit epsilon [Chloroflexi bacterium RBG_16_48_7]